MAGAAISQYYDNLVAKLVVWGRDREEAIARGQRALRAFRVTGIATTIPAHLQILDTDAFRTATHYTRFVEDQLDFSGLSAGTAPALPQDEEVDQRTITVEVGGRRFGVTFWAPVMAPAGGGGQRLAPRRRPRSWSGRPRPPRAPGSSPPRCRERSSRSTTPPATP